MNKKMTLKLTSIVVIIVSLFFVAMFFTKEPVKKITLRNADIIAKNCLAQYPGNDNAFRDCYYLTNLTSHQKLERERSALGFLAFGLPILFFGGIGLYRFVPKKKKKTN